MLAWGAGLGIGWTASAAVLVAFAQTSVPQPLLHVVGVETLSLQSSYVELIVQDAKRRQFGLCTPLGGSFLQSVSVQNGTATVLEQGVIRKTALAPTGTILRISITDGTVGFLKNGGAIFVSALPLLEPPRGEVALEDGTTVLGRLTSWSQPANAAPALVILQPSPGVTVQGVILLQAGTTPGAVLPSAVTFTLTSATLTAIAGTAVGPAYTVSWTSTSVPNGVYQLTATSGAVASPAIALTVAN